MISLLPFPLRLARVAVPGLAFVAFLAGLSGCQDRSADGGTTDGTSTVSFYTPDGKPAVNARVQVFASSDTTRIPRAQAFTDAEGRVDLPVLDADLYNLVARDESGRAIFQDSLVSDGKSMDYTSDTLVGTGVVIGRIRVQPQHDPRIVWIALLGAGTYLNVDDSGRFRIEGVPEGKFTLAGFTKTEGYTTTFDALRVKRDSTSDIGILDMVFTALPVVQNLEARFDTLAGLVHLRWDSLALRQTWKYTVLRDARVVGETTGPRWIDTVSDEYPADVPSQGRHAYRVVVSDARGSGPVWESIEMRIISSYLYEEVKVDWVRKAELPWPSSSIRIDLADSILGVWRSVENGTEILLPGESLARTVRHRGWVQRWSTMDSGQTWTKNSDSLPLGALPVAFDGAWWSIRRSTAGFVERGDDSLTPNSGIEVSLPYGSLVVVRSTDGVRWDSIASLVPSRRLYDSRLEVGEGRLWILGADDIYGFAGDQFGWSIGPGAGKPVFEENWLEQNRLERTPYLSVGLYPASRTWHGAWREVSFGVGFWQVDKRRCTFRTGSFSIPHDADWMPKLVRISETRLALFGVEDSAISMDSTISQFHAMPSPHRRRHVEAMWGGRILSISDAGVYLGRILSGLEGGDPRGTWVKKTETPRVF